MRFMLFALIASLSAIFSLCSSFAEEGKAVRSPRATVTNYVPHEVDPTEKTERVLLLAPSGPLVIELSMTIDSEPFRTHREKMIDEALNDADSDMDNKVTWDELFAQPEFASGSFASVNQNKEVKKRFTARQDLNSNGVVDRMELRSLFAQYKGGPTFNVRPGLAPQSPRIRELLDVNKDGILQHEELAAAETRLKSRDANDDDFVDLAELERSPTATLPVQTLVFHLHKETDWNNVFKLLNNTYGKDGKLTSKCFPLVSDLMEKLDEDGDGTLQEEELVSFLDIESHLYYEVNLGKSDKLPSGGRLEIGTSSLAKMTTLTLGETSTLESIGARVEFSVSNPQPNFNSLDRYATQILNRYDKDKNGYIEKDELGKQAQFAQQIAVWDMNEDGKVYPKEIRTYYKRLQVPTWQRVTIIATDHGNSLFTLLDADTDGRLRLREMRAAPVQLKQADKNGDKQLTLDEVPRTMQFVVSRGSGYTQRQISRTPRGRTASRDASAEKAISPKWFFRMDKNEDGDISPREFLGDADQFKQLDTNGDSFIDLEEAKAAE